MSVIDSNESFQKPKIDLLEEEPDDVPTVSEEDLKITGLKIEHILATNNIQASLLSATPGPVFTQFRVLLEGKASGDEIDGLEKVISRGLCQPTIRVEKEVVCKVEVPNSNKRVISLREIIGRKAFAESKSKLTLASGLSSSGEPVVIDLAKAPHILVSGFSGSGKTVSLHAMILSMLFKCTPEDLKLLLIDPKMQEFGLYEDIPHLLTPVVTDIMKAYHALQWCVSEMDRRYNLMREVGVKNIETFNQKIEQAQAQANDSFLPNPLSPLPDNPGPLKRMPYIVVIVDELADLLLMYGKQVEPPILRLTQKGRAAGLHLILATQRPSNDIVTPVIKTNCPTRMCFKVDNRYESETLIDASGAEDLLCPGDMFLMRSGTPLTRVHGANVKKKEIKQVTAFLKEQGRPDYVEGVTEPHEDEPEETRFEFEREYGNDCQKFRNAEEKRLIKFRGSFQKPSVELLDELSEEVPTVSEEALNNIGLRIEHILATYKIKVSVLSAIPGPVITLFRVKPDEGVRSNRITQIAKDLARGLGQSTLRVVYNIYEIGCIGLEVPNTVSRVISLREIIGSPVFAESKSKLTLALGLSITGEPVVMDLAKAPHLLVAGSTGSGKTVGLHTMILSMLFKCTPEDLRLVLIDPKMMEFAPYENIPHLLTPVLTDMRKAAHALHWCANEMERRYNLMRKVGVRNITAFNQKVEQAGAGRSFIPDPMSLTSENPEPLKRMPYIVVIIDELADLYLMCSKQVEPLILRLTQKGRAAGLHVILATQRPINDIVTPIIKTNCPTRISFKVANRYDSATILGESGAEDLLGRGDMFLMRSGTPLTRVHGSNVTDEEIKQVTDFLKEQGAPDYVEGVTEAPKEDEPDEPAKGPSPKSEYGSLYDKACQIVINEKKCSISYLQRRLGIGYNRAANIVEQMERDGLVSAPSPTCPREVFDRDKAI